MALACLPPLNEARCGNMRTLTNKIRWMLPLFVATVSVAVGQDEPVAETDPVPGVAAVQEAAETEAAETGVAESDLPELLKLDTLDINGEEVSLGQYAGKVMLVVNVASKCGFTSQYSQLQELHNKFADDGLVVLGFPCNQFKGQEPGDEQQIKQFCEHKYGVTFDMFSKIDVKGDNQHELYRQLTKLDLRPAGAGDVKWNFEKFLVGRDGVPVARFNTKVAPYSKPLLAAIELALEQPVPEKFQHQEQSAAAKVDEKEADDETEAAEDHGETNSDSK